MNWMNKLERKFGRYAIPDITRYMVIAMIIGYALYYMASFSQGISMILYYIKFSPAMIFRGQIWRLVTWLIFPSGVPSIWSFLFIICLLMLGQSMESYMGTFRMNIYFLGGILLNDIFGLIIYAITGVEIYVTLYYIVFAMYLMLGIFMPDATVRLYFVLPIKMKWLMILYGAELLYEIITYFRYGAATGIAYSAEIILSLVNLGIFYWGSKQRVTVKQKMKQTQFHSQMRQQAAPQYSGGARHKCAICGRTELDDPNLEFRFCSKCQGNYEYCQDHLFTHQHKKLM